MDAWCWGRRELKGLRLPAKPWIVWHIDFIILHIVIEWFIVHYGTLGDQTIYVRLGLRDPCVSTRGIASIDNKGLSIWDDLVLILIIRDYQYGWLYTDIEYKGISVWDDLILTLIKRDYQYLMISYWYWRIISMWWLFTDIDNNGLSVLDDIIPIQIMRDYQYSVILYWYWN